MKKIILLSAAIASAFAGSAQANCHKPASGYNFTIGAGFKGLNGRQLISTHGRPVNYIDKVKISGGTGAFVASLGFGQQGVFSPNSYLGIEINGNVGKVKSSASLTAPSGSNTIGYLTSFENKYNIGGALRVGYVKSDNTVLFVTVGGNSGRFDFRYTDVTASKQTRSPLKKKHLSGVTWGFGAQTHFKKVLLKGEVGFTQHKSFKLVDYKPPIYPSGYSTAGTGGKFTPRTSIASVSVGYSW